MAQVTVQAESAAMGVDTLCVALIHCLADNFPEHSQLGVALLNWERQFSIKHNLQHKSVSVEEKTLTQTLPALPSVESLLLASKHIKESMLFLSSNADIDGKVLDMLSRLAILLESQHEIHTTKHNN
jgi:hypothetical protein